MSEQIYFRSDDDHCVNVLSDGESVVIEVDDARLPNASSVQLTGADELRGVGLALLRAASCGDVKISCDQFDEFAAALVMHAESMRRAGGRRQPYWVTMGGDNE